MNKSSLASRICFLRLIVLAVARGGADRVDPWQDGCLHSVGVTVVEELHLQTETDCKFSLSLTHLSKVPIKLTNAIHMPVVTYGVSHSSVW